MTYDTKECFRTRLKTRSAHGEHSWCSQVQAWYKPEHTVSANGTHIRLFGDKRTHICLLSPSFDCTVAMTKSQNHSTRRTRHWDNSCSCHVWHKQSYSKKIKATYDLGEMEYLSIEKPASARYHQCYSETGRIASALRSYAHYVREY